MNYPLKFVQILRGFAAIAVLLHHAGIYARQFFNNAAFGFEYGSLGVDFFFALSGFIITCIHFRDITGKGNVKRFMLRRFIRIFPFYWLTLLLVVVFDVSAFPGWKIFAENMLLFRLPMSEMPLKVAWSLTFEIVFYLLFGLAIAAGWRAARIILIIWLLLIIFSPAVSNTLYNTLVSNLNIEFLFGCFAGYLFIQGKFMLGGIVFIGGLFTIAVTFIICNNFFGFDRFNIIMTTLLGAASGWIILHAALLDRAQRYRTFALPLLVVAGDASYAIYLTHTVYMPYLFKGVNNMIGSSIGYVMQTMIIVILVLLSIAIGIMIHKLIEKPMLIFLRRKLHSFSAGASLS